MNIANIPLDVTKNDTFRQRWQVINALEEDYDWADANIVSAYLTIRYRNAGNLYAYQFSTENHSTSGQPSIKLTTGFIDFYEMQMKLEADTYDYDLEFRDNIGNKYTRVIGEFKVFDEMTSTAYATYKNNSSSNPSKKLLKIEPFDGATLIKLQIDPKFEVVNIGTAGVPIVGPSTGNVLTLKSIEAGLNIQVLDHVVNNSVLISTDAVAVSEDYTDQEITNLKNYVDAQDVIVLQDAKDYTDQEINDLTSYVNNEVLQLEGMIINASTSGKEYTDAEIAELKNYVDARDVIVLNTANAYTDAEINDLTTYVNAQDLILQNQITNASTSGKEYTDQEIAELKNYVDVQDVATLDLADDYTDQEVLNLKNYVDAKDLYLTGLIVNASTSGKEYTDQEINDLKSYVDVQDAQTLQDAEDYTDAAIAGIVFPDSSTSGFALTAAYAYDYDKTYINNQDAATLAAANLYTDNAIDAIVFPDASTAGWATNAVNSYLLGGNGPLYYLDRANHTGTQLVSTISNIGTASVAYAANSGTAAYALSSPSAAYVFSNGLYSTSGIVRLGGALTQDTALAGAKLLFGPGSFGDMAIGSSYLTTAVADGLKIVHGSTPDGNRRIELIYSNGSYFELRALPPGGSPGFYGSTIIPAPEDGVITYLATKRYVDNLTGGTAGYTSANGITKNLTTFELGGALNRNTEITGNYTLDLGSTGSNLANVNVRSNIISLNGNTNAVISTGTNSVGTTSAGVLVTLDTGDTFTYAGNYTANFVARSLVDKAYVDASTAGNAANAFLLQSQNGAYYLNRANHTGTQTVSTISNFSSGTAGYAFNSGMLGSQMPSYYLSRANHTGTQTVSTISDFSSGTAGYAFNTPLTFSNGLTKNVNAVTLGGTLTADVIFNGNNNTHDFIIGGSGTEIDVLSLRGRTINITSTQNPTTITGDVNFSTGVANFNSNTRMAYSGGTLSRDVSGNISWNIALTGNVVAFTLPNSTTSTMQAPQNMIAYSKMCMILVQGGASLAQVTWNSVYKWPGGIPPTLSTGAGATDIFEFWTDGTYMYGSVFGLNY